LEEDLEKKLEEGKKEPKINKKLAVVIDKEVDRE
jgi:hypothetical protein